MVFTRKNNALGNQTLIPPVRDPYPAVDHKNSCETLPVSNAVVRQSLVFRNKTGVVSPVLQRSKPLPPSKSSLPSATHIQNRAESEKIASDIHRRKMKGMLAVELSEDFNRLYWNYEFCDVVFRSVGQCEGETFICAHKALLKCRAGENFVENISCASGAMNDSFFSQESNGIETVYVDIEEGFEVLKDAMKYLYCGQLFWDAPLGLELIVAKLYLLVRFAERLGLTGLEGKCHKLIKRCHDGDIVDYETFKLFNKIQVDNDNSGALLESICPGKDKDGVQPPVQVLHSSFLGKDLSKILNDQSSADLVFNVNGTLIYAHRAVVCTRSSLFSSMLSGPWLESESNEICIHSVGPSTVLHVLHFLYTGVVDIEDEEEDLEELLFIADMYEVEGLKKLVASVAWSQKCHSFHQPCSGCIEEFGKWLVLADRYGMDELKTEILKWCCKHKVRVWPTRAFAKLPQNLTDEVYNLAISIMNGDKGFLRIFTFLKQCDQIYRKCEGNSPLRSVFWISKQCKQQCITRLCQNFNMIRYNSDFISLTRGEGWTFHLVEEIIDCLMLMTCPSNCVANLVYSENLIQMLNSNAPKGAMENGNIAEKMKSHVIKMVAANLEKLRPTPEYVNLSSDLKDAVEEAALLTCSMNISFSIQETSRRTGCRLRRESSTDLPPMRTELPMSDEAMFDEMNGNCTGNVELGARVLLTENRTGVIRFVGQTCFAEGIWFGIELDQPVGKHDGEVQRVRYFTTNRKCATFVRPSAIVRTFQ
eukprot:Nk52_evm84s485 gene=Nk52_evmTU84s485